MEVIEQLRQMAIQASHKAYSPYSKALVGSALITTDGQLYSGCNVENSSFGATVCAERVAIFKAVSEKEMRVAKIYVYTSAGWPPCGICRQVLSEFADPELEVIIGDKSGTIKTMSFKDLMPLAFEPNEYHRR